MDARAASPSARIIREKCTVETMIGLYCRAQHDTDGRLCNSCDRLLNYAQCRLDRCPFGAEKTPCGSCPVHCYSAAMRSRIKEVMRYAGPRMLLRHPIMALRHQWDRFRGEGGSLR